MRLLKLSVLALVPPLLFGCSAIHRAPPVPFHDTRMLSAMIAGEDAKLERDYGMKPPPNWAERIVAGAVLPFTVATETTFLPVFLVLRQVMPPSEAELSGQ